MSVSTNEDMADFEPNQTEKQREEDYWGKLEGDTDFDLPPDALEQSCAGKSQTAQGACSQKAPCDKAIGQIQHGMEVIASCGNRIGKVDHLDGDDSIKLMKHDAQADGVHHWIPTSWVERVDAHVHLNLNSQEAMNRWKTEETAACGSCSR